VAKLLIMTEEQFQVFVDSDSHGYAGGRVDLLKLRKAMTEVDLGDDIIEEADEAHYQRRLAEALAASHEYAQLARIKGAETEELTNG